MEREEDQRAEVEQGLSPSKTPKRLETFYIMGPRSLSLDPEAASVINLLTTSISHAIVDVRVVAQPPDADENVAMTFLRKLMALPNLIFRGA